MERGMISVDKWRAGSQAYFLTHLHADHTAGLSSSWNRGPLFCSRLTAKLFPCKFPGFDLSLLRVLDIGCWHALSLTTISSGSAVDVYVKPIDAQHCPALSSFELASKANRELSPCFNGPFIELIVQVAYKLELLERPNASCYHLKPLNGRKDNSLSLPSVQSGEIQTVPLAILDTPIHKGAVMYLFHGEFGCMLFTGDFRWEKDSDVANNGRSMLLDTLKNEKLDILYLDNTYCNPRYSFPDRKVTARQVVDIINAHPDHEIIIGIDSLGKEDLLIHISRALNIKIWVWPERLQIMHVLGFQNHFTTKASLTRVRAVPRYSFSIDTLERLNVFKPTIGVMPSGLPWAVKYVNGSGNIFGSPHFSTCLDESNCKVDTISCSKMHDLNGDLGNAKRYHEYIYVVPYSDHSCFAEIQEFVELLRPIRIKGIVSSSSSFINPQYYFGHLCGTQQAVWRIHQKLGHEEMINKVEDADMKATAAVTSTAASRRKRRIDLVDNFGVRVSKVHLMRRLSRGVRISDFES